MNTIYLDNAATSFPKPPATAQRIYDYICNNGATINRSVYTSAQKAGLVTISLRERLCRLFNFSDPKHVIITGGNTIGINMILKGYLHPGGHCIVSSVEHNAVMRPLNQLARFGVSFDRLPCSSDGLFDPQAIHKLIRQNTKLVIITHASNVGGGIQDIEAVGRICAQYNVPFALDAAQTAGHLPIDFQSAQLSALSVPGHKGLMGPSGIGAILLRPDFAAQIEPLISGGTGSVSDSEQLPEYMPDRFEPGTPNLPGIYGFEASLEYLESVGINNIRQHDQKLTLRFLEGISQLEGIRILGPNTPENRVGVISLDFIGQDNAECAYMLETNYGILTRCGLHCAPSAHKTFGTFPQGTVRFSLGWFNTESDVDCAIHAIKNICKN